MLRLWRWPSIVTKARENISYCLICRLGELFLFGRSQWILRTAPPGSSIDNSTVTPGYFMTTHVNIIVALLGLPGEKKLA